MTVHAVLVTAADQPGILFGLTRVLAEHEANITHVDSHSGHEVSEIYMEFQLDGHDPGPVMEQLRQVSGVRQLAETPSRAKIWGKRIIVIGGGAPGRAGGDGRGRRGRPSQHPRGADLD